MVVISGSSSAALNTVHRVRNVSSATAFDIGVNAAAAEYVTIHTGAFGRRSECGSDQPDPERLHGICSIEREANWHHDEKHQPRRYTGRGQRESRHRPRGRTCGRQDIALIYNGSGNWETARTDALVSARTDGHSAKSYEFESYKSLVLNSGGLNYKIGDTITITNTAVSGTAGSVVVTAVSGTFSDSQEGGAVLSFKLDESSRGTNYAQGTNVASTGGSGSGATFDINRVRSNGSLYREFETEYTSVSETTANTFTNDGKDATTIAAERYAITNEASGVTFNYVLPSILTEANTLPSGSKSIAFMVRSGSDPHWTNPRSARPPL